MDILAVAIFAANVASMLNTIFVFLLVGLGLGLVVFIHELGHFSVAKWCDVKVERFSIGFGPIIWKYTRGETEYALSIIPLGGYVKMLGQDDIDPAHNLEANVVQDPRSYMAKTVPQRMAIISAGVIFNLISAAFFFILSYGLGVHFIPAVLGNVSPGGPAWTAGLRLGDRLQKVGDREDAMLSFFSLRQKVALSDGPVEIAGLRDGKPFRLVVNPSSGELFPEIGVSPSPSLRLQRSMDPDVSPTLPGTPAARAKPPFEGGDIVQEIDGVKIEGYPQLQLALAAKRDQPVEFGVRRHGEKPGSALHVIKVDPLPMRRLGLRMDIGKISAIQLGSPAERAKLKVGDKITHVIVDRQEKSVGTDLDPLMLPNFFADLHGREVTLRVKREVQGSDSASAELTVIPDNRPGWVEQPLQEDSPISVPALGVAFHVLHHVVKVEPDSAAAGQVLETDNIQKAEIVFEESAGASLNPYKIEFGVEKRNWALLFWSIQLTPVKSVKLTLRSQGKTEDRVVELVPRASDDWFMPMRGLKLTTEWQLKQAENIGEAVSLGFQSTQENILEMYLMLKGLLVRRISPKALGGPLTIFSAAQSFAERGIADLIQFLGILSISLAVLNFLPIPVLDGGHFVFLLWEGIRGKRPNPQLFLTASYIGFGLILTLMAWVFFLDIRRFLFK